MNMIRICTRNELFKILHSMKYKLFMGVSAALVISVFLAGTLSGNPVSFFGGNYPYFVLSLCCYLFVPFAAFSLTADLISGEYERNELKLIVTRHISRSKLLIGKLAAITVYEVLLILVNVIPSAVLTVIFCGISSVNLLTVLISVIITILPIMSVVAFAGFISVLCRTSITAFIGEIAAYASVTISALIFTSISRVFFTSYLAIYKMTIGQTIPVFELIMGAAVLIGSVLMFLPCSCMAFDKKDI